MTVSRKANDLYEVLKACPNKLCPMCDGKGEIMDDEAVGTEMRRRRLLTGLSLRTVAKRLKFSAPYISDLEKGRRNWSHYKVGDYLDAISPEYKAPELFIL